MAEEEAAAASSVPNGLSKNGLAPENGLQDDDSRVEADQKTHVAEEAVAAKEEPEERPITARRQAKKSPTKGERAAPMKAEHPG